MFLFYVLRVRLKLFMSAEHEIDGGSGWSSAVRAVVVIVAIAALSIACTMRAA